MCGPIVSGPGSPPWWWSGDTTTLGSYVKVGSDRPGTQVLLYMEVSLMFLGFGVCQDLVMCSIIHILGKYFFLDRLVWAQTLGFPE